MKLQHTLSFFLALLLLASCSNSKDVVSDRWIQKRKYNKGYFITKRGAAPEIDSKSNEETAIEVTPVLLLSDANPTELSNIPRSEYKSIEDRAPRNNDASSTAQVNNSENEVADHAMVEVASFEPRRHRASIEHQTSFRLDETDHTDDTEMLIYLVIALFIAWLSVGILYNWGTEFLIALILWFLFWLPGTLYGIIKVLQHYGKL